MMGKVSLEKKIFLWTDPTLCPGCGFFLETPAEYMKDTELLKRTCQNCKIEFKQLTALHTRSKLWRIICLIIGVGFIGIFWLLLSLLVLGSI